MCRRLVISDYKSIYPDPISVRKGDKLKFGRQDNWDGHIWVWAIAGDLKEGWVPDNLCDGEMVVKRDYSAIELTCKVGDEVTVILEDHGWAWCSNEENQKGWIPLKNLSENNLK